MRCSIVFIQNLFFSVMLLKISDYMWPDCARCVSAVKQQQTVCSGSHSSFCDCFPGRKKYSATLHLSIDSHAFIHLTFSRPGALWGPQTLFCCQSPWNTAGNEIPSQTNLQHEREITPTPSEWLTARRPPIIPRCTHQRRSQTGDCTPPKNSHIWYSEREREKMRAGPPSPPSPSSSSSSSATNRRREDGRSRANLTWELLRDHCVQTFSQCSDGRSSRHQWPSQASVRAQNKGAETASHRGSTWGTGPSGGRRGV